MIPILHSADSTEWNSFGIGALSDTIMCEVEENRNGSFELEMQYPVTGKHYSNIVMRSIIIAKPNFTDDPQPFRIYRISKPLNGVVQIYARHITYDLSGYVDGPFQAVGVQAAMVAMTNNTYIYPQNCPFEFYTDMSSTKVMKTVAPTSVRALMGGVSGSLIDLYGGEWAYDGYQSKLLAHRGTNRGVTIRYGKNLTELVHDENAESLYTAVYPFYHNKTTNEMVSLPEKVIPVIESPSFSNVLALDLTDKFQSVPTAGDIRTAAHDYIDSHELATPKVNITLDFVQSENLKDRVDLCDTVSVYFDALGVSVTEKCIRTKWDVLKERYSEIEVGSARNSIAATIASVDEKTEAAIEVVSRGVSDIASAAASKITGNLGGYVVMHDLDADGHPDEILIMDTEDVETAVHIIRMNQGGIAFSSDGYYGTYTSAWNINGQFVADFITAGTLSADMVKILGDTQFYWDAGNIYIMDPNDANQQIRIGLYDGEHYGIGFTHDGGASWQTAMDFNGLHVSATGFSKTYVQTTEPTGGEYNIGDIWVKTSTMYTWNMVAEDIWNDFANHVWDDMGGTIAPNMYTWNGLGWQKVYDGESVTTLRADLTVAEGRIDAQATAITDLDGQVTTNTTNIGIVGGNLTAEIARATGAEAEAITAINATADGLSAEITRAGNAESQLSTRIQTNANGLAAEITRAGNAEDDLSTRINATAEGISTEVQKGLNGQGGYTSVYQTSSQVQTIVGQNAYTKNTTVNISTAGVDIGTTGHVQIGASGSGVTIDKNGVDIDTGGHLTVDAQNLEISADGSLSARNAYLSGDIYSNNKPVMTKGGDVVVSTSQPAGHAGMIWIQPDPSASTSAEYSFPIPSSWGNRVDLNRSHKTGTLAGTGASTSFRNCTYKIAVPIYIRSHSGQPAGGTLKCVVSNSSQSITFTATVNESSTGLGDKVVEMTATSSTWIGAANNLSFTLSCDAISGYYVYNILNSSDTSASITLECTATGQTSGWVAGNVKVFI